MAPHMIGVIGPWVVGHVELRISMTDTYWLDGQSSYERTLACFNNQVATSSFPPLYQRYPYSKTASTMDISKTKTAIHVMWDSHILFVITFYLPTFSLGGCL